MAFLHGPEILRRISQALIRCSGCDLAVAYWGRNAAATLSLSKVNGPTRILCDARSGACNPTELRSLMDMPNVTLKARDQLHAKVYWTSEIAIVGSANASTNGLGEEEREPGKLEAALEITEASTLDEIRAWFETEWESGELVDADLLEQVRPLWKGVRQNRPRRGERGTILEVLRKRPEFFKDLPIQIIAYERTDRSRADYKKFESIAPDLYLSTDLARFEKKGELPFYADDYSWGVSPGDYIVDYSHSGQPSQLRYGGMWRVRQEHAFHSVGKKRRIVLVDEVKEVFGLTFPKESQTALRKALSGFLRHETRDLECSLEELVNLLGNRLRQE